MKEYYLTSLIILPHGITDLTRASIQSVPLLLITYLIGLVSCGGLHELIQYGHIGLFLGASLIHFYRDFKDVGHNAILSASESMFVVATPCILLYYDMLLYAKYFMMLYMISFHVPLHYKRLQLKRKDIAPLLCTTFLFGIMGPSLLKDIEENEAEGLYSIMGCGLVVGHVAWNV